MKTMNQWLEEYGDSHRNKTNKLIHWICVPSIMFTVVALLYSIPAAYLASAVPQSIAGYANWAAVVIILAVLFYLRLSVTMALGMLFTASVMFFISRELSALNWAPLWQIALVIFIVAWIFQFIGHILEGKKPSFFKDLQFLLIGPAWILSFIYRKLGIPY